VLRFSPEPVIGPGSWDSRDVLNPSVAKFRGTYYNLYSAFDGSTWQFPVVLIPLGTAAAPDSVVLRPIQSVDGMTAEAVVIPDPLLSELATELLAIPGITGIFRDLTDKPPATIEWE